MKNPMQLKARIKKFAMEKKTPPQIVMQNYVMERFLERVAHSKYRDAFVLKGGMLISSMIGIEARTTRDIDMTLVNTPLSHARLREVFSEIASINIHDSFAFEIVDLSDIRESVKYPGIRLSLKACYPPISERLKVDITVGDRMTPSAIEYAYPCMFENKSIKIQAYNIETLLAEKIETILSRGIYNTRAWDFYDVHVLSHLYQLNISVLKDALIETFKARGTHDSLLRAGEIINDITNEPEMQKSWKSYVIGNQFACDIPWENVCSSVRALLSGLL